MRRCVAIVGCAALLASASAQGARAASAQRAIALLNAQRAASGLPGDIVEDPALTADCAAHDRYMALNHQLTHFEQQGKPGYTDGGSYAGRNSVLSEGASWSDGNPYESAPLHLDQLLAPRLRTLGSADLDGYSCTTTFPGWTRPDPPVTTVYAYPGNRSRIVSSEVARELPWTPGQLVGIAQRTRTGPYLIVFVDAPGRSPYGSAATLSGATLTGPSGPVAVKTVDGDTRVPGHGTLAPYLYPGGFIIPVHPLDARTTYRAHVVVTFAGVQTAHDWSFRTRVADPHSSLSAARGTLRFSSRSPQPIRVTFTRSGGRHARSVTIRPGAAVRLHLRPGSWQACGHQPGSSAFAGYDGCIAIIVTGVPMLRLGSGHPEGGRLVFALGYSAVLRGRAATLTTTRLAVRCGPTGCSTVAGRSSRRMILLNVSALSFPLPAHGHGLRVKVRTGAFQLRDAPWRSARAIASFVR